MARAEGSVFDPDQAPEVINAAPQGTVAELEAEGMDPAQYGACARRNKAGGILGCPEFHRCRLSIKGKAGPEYAGVEIIKGKSDGPPARSLVDCTWIAKYRDDIVENGGSLTVLAMGGESFTAIRNVTVDPLTREEVSQYTPGCIRDDKEVVIEVPKFVRPGKSKQHLATRLKNASREAMKEQLENEQRARSLGLDATRPLDSDRPGVRGGKAK